MSYQGFRVSRTYSVWFGCYFAGEFTGESVMAAVDAARMTVPGAMRTLKLTVEEV